MTPYQLKDGNYIHNLDTDDLIKRIGVMWAKLERPGRVHTVQYTRVPFMTEYTFTCAEPPPLQGCQPPPREIVVYMPDAMLVAINASSGIRFITRPAA